MISPTRLKDAERIARTYMALMLLTAGISKFFSDGGFFDYYSGLFQADLRIHLPAWLVDSYLRLIPFIELIIGIALLLPRLRQPALLAWFAFMASLTVGHYVLQEWSAVNQMIDYILIGLVAYILPYHQAMIARD